MNRHLLITGGAGFIGCNLADRLAADGHRVLLFDSLARPGVKRNIAWLQGRHPGMIRARIADVRDPAAVAEGVRGAGAVFHLAAQVAVTSSLDDPGTDLQVNLLGTANVLEAVRLHAPDAPLIFASTNKVYGGMDSVPLRTDHDRYIPEDAAIRDAGFDERTPLEFHTPYGCSKGAADQYVLDYARSFGLRTVVLRMSCIYGPRQLGTEDQGWVAHFLMRALARRPITIYGDGKQVRDILHVGDAVEAYVSAWRRAGTVSGLAFNLGGGPENAVSLLQVLRHAGRLLGRPLDLRFSSWRPNDQRYYVSNPCAARNALGFPPPRNWREGIADLLADIAERHDASHGRADVAALSA